MTKVTYIEAVDYALVGTTGAPAQTLDPGQRVVFQEDNAAHADIKRSIESDENTTLRIISVDPAAEKQAEEEREKQLEQAAEIAQKAAQEQLEAERASREAVSDFNPEENSVKDVIAYMKEASPEEATRVQELEASSSRASKQVADFDISGSGGGTEGDPGLSPGQDSPSSADPGGGGDGSPSSAANA